MRPQESDSAPILAGAAGPALLKVKAEVGRWTGSDHELGLITSD